MPDSRRRAGKRNACSLVPCDGCMRPGVVVVSGHQNDRQSLPDYCRDNLLNKYGLPSMADGYVVARAGQSAINCRYAYCTDTPRPTPPLPATSLRWSIKW